MKYEVTERHGYVVSRPERNEAFVYNAKVVTPDGQVHHLGSGTVSEIDKDALKIIEAYKEKANKMADCEHKWGWPHKMDDYKEPMQKCISCGDVKPCAIPLPYAKLEAANARLWDGWKSAQEMAKILTARIEELNDENDQLRDQVRGFTNVLLFIACESEPVYEEGQGLEYAHLNSDGKSRLAKEVLEKHAAPIECPDL